LLIKNLLFTIDNATTECYNEYRKEAGRMWEMFREIRDTLVAIVAIVGLAYFLKDIYSKTKKK